MIDFAQAKIDLIEEYTSLKKRKNEEVVAFHAGMNYLIDYLSGKKERLNDYIPAEKVYGVRTMKNVARLWEKEYSQKMEKLEAGLQEERRKDRSELEEKLKTFKERLRKEKRAEMARFKKEYEQEQKANACNSGLTPQEIKAEEQNIRLTLRREAYARLLKQQINSLQGRCSKQKKMINKLLQQYNKLQSKFPLTKGVGKVVVATDSFKGCLTSEEAEEAIAKGVRAVWPKCRVVCLPVADGGEGVQRILTGLTGGSTVSLTVHNPLMERCEACYGLSGDGKIAFVETAAASGLPLIAPERRNPMLTTSYGTGELIRHALDRGCRDFIVGLGGSATNDAGLGMLQALGFRFLNEAGEELARPEEGHAICGAQLAEVATIDYSGVHPGLPESHFIAACDVQNPLYGLRGAACVFAPQKGADAEMVGKLDEGLRHIARIIERDFLRDVSSIPGAGAAGGIGGAMLGFLNAQLKSGITLLLDTYSFATHIQDADFVITGEGRADRQSLMGKVASGVLERARLLHVPVVMLAGSVEETKALNEAGFQGVFPILSAPLSLEEAMDPDTARANLERTAEQVCRLIRKQQKSI